MLAAVLSRRLRDLAWVGLAAVGVALPAFERTELDLAGVGFALLAAAMWATYILLSAQTGRRWDGIEGLALASVVSTVLLAPFAVGRREGPARPHDPARGRGGGPAQPAIPYACDLVALRRIRPTCSAS